MDGHGPGRELDLFTGPDPGVGAFAVDLDGADAAGNLLDFPGQRGDAGADGVFGDRGGAAGGGDLAFGVVRHGGFTEPDGGGVGLGRAHDVGQQPGGLVDAHHQNAGGHRIQRPGVADLSGTGDPPHPSNHIVAGPTLRLVHYHQSRKHASQYMRASPGPARATGSAAGPPAKPGHRTRVRMAGMPELAAHVRDVPINQIREITEAAWGTPGAIVLSIGEPGFAVPRHVLEAGMACLDRDETNYTPNAGIPALREAFAARFREHNATPVGAERVYVVDGAQQGLHFAMSLLLSPGDEILIPNPGYPTFAMTSSLLHAVPVRYPLYPEHDFQPRIEDIEALITPRTKVLILNSPSNPLGAVLGEDLTRRLVELARRHDLWVISDECYEAFTYDVPHVSPARFDSDVPGEARVFTSLTLSKTYGLTGLRIGALICPPGLEQKMNNVMESIVSCVASPSQYAALAALTGPQDYVSHAHAHYRANRDAASAVLRSRGIRYLARPRRVLSVGGRLACQRRGCPGLDAPLPGGLRRGLRPRHGVRLHRRGLDPHCALRQTRPILWRASAASLRASRRRHRRVNRPYRRRSWRPSLNTRRSQAWPGVLAAGCPAQGAADSGRGSTSCGGKTCCGVSGMG